jgi:hypothetical protein
MLGRSGRATHRHLIESDCDDYLGRAFRLVLDDAGRRDYSASVSVSVKRFVVYCDPAALWWIRTLGLMQAFRLSGTCAPRRARSMQAVLLTGGHCQT